MLLFLMFLNIGTIFSQPIPSELLLYRSKKILYDFGEDWKSISCFGPIRFQQLENHQLLSGSLNINTRFSTYFLNDDITLSNFTTISFKKYFYCYFYPHVVSNSRLKEFYSGEEYKRIKSSFNESEIGFSGIGFQNKWAIIQIGRGRENWGTGNDIQLALSKNSDAYDYFMLGSDYGNIRVKYIHGFLESTNEGFNRYITARGIEWSNKKSLLIAFSEIVIYSGLNRPFDLAYLNPISSHIEIELNNRLNDIPSSNEPSSANGVWQASVDWLITDKIRFSGNYLYDEFVLDPELEVGKVHGKAHSFRFSYNLINKKTYALNVFGSNIQVGTPTFRHSSGTNNFVQTGNPLGWEIGSDSENINLGLNYLNDNNFLCSIISGFIRKGEESITDRVFERYPNYQKGPFPSGIVSEIVYIDTYLHWQFSSHISIFSKATLRKIKSKDPLKNDITLQLGIYASWKKLFSF